VTGIQDDDAAMAGRPSGSTGAAPDERVSSRASGPGRLLIAVYGLFALAATARAAFQITTKFGEAPVAYLLSALAAVVYIVATVSLARPGAHAYRVSVVAVTIELIGVVAVGLLSIYDAQAFPAETVWSAFGRGYGFVPLVLPVLGLVWLHRNRPDVRGTPEK
jgi:cytochrome bd-type quinol oxidase subunit 2